jgi:cytochrome c biogenesis protein CcdA
MTTIEWWFALGAVVLLGLQTSISPCPLATNIAAISYITRKVGKTREVLLSGLLYALGRTLAYVVLAILVLSAMLWSGEAMTRFLQTQIHGYLGPVLTVIGLMLLGWLSFNIGGIQGEKMQKIADTLGLWSALPIGVIFAMAFCPTSAATFLATIALASQFQSNVLFPVVFGIGTAVPVLVFAGIIALNAQLLGKVFSMMSKIDWWMRTVAGTLFIVVGLWFSFKYVYVII